MNDPVLEFASVSARIGTVPILRDVSFAIRPGERLAIIGPSGSGKSSLLRVACGLLKHSEGDIRLFGEPLPTKGHALRQARQRMALIFQSFNLYGMKTVIENVMLPLTELKGLDTATARQQARAALDRVACAALAERYPFELSGGQQQRVAIARAIVVEPQILLLDEPTASLDPELVQSALHLLADVVRTGSSRGPMSLICVTHDIGFGRRLADRMIFMDQGRIIESGTPDQLVDAPATPRLKAFLDARQ